MMEMGAAFNASTCSHFGDSADNFIYKSSYFFLKNSSSKVNIFPI